MWLRRVNERKPFLVGGRRRKLGELDALSVECAELELKIGKRIGRVDQLRLAHGAMDRANPIGPLGMMRPGHVLDEPRG